MSLPKEIHNLEKQYQQKIHNQQKVKEQQEQSKKQQDAQKAAQIALEVNEAIKAALPSFLIDYFILIKPEQIEPYKDSQEVQPNLVIPGHTKMWFRVQVKLKPTLIKVGSAYSVQKPEINERSHIVENKEKWYVNEYYYEHDIPELAKALFLAAEFFAKKEEMAAKVKELNAKHKKEQRQEQKKKKLEEMINNEVNRRLTKLVAGILDRFVDTY